MGWRHGPASGTAASSGRRRAAAPRPHGRRAAVARAHPERPGGDHPAVGGGRKPQKSASLPSRRDLATAIPCVGRSRRRPAGADHDAGAGRIAAGCMPRDRGGAARAQRRGDGARRCRHPAAAGRRSRFASCRRRRVRRSCRRPRAAPRRCGPRRGSARPRPRRCGPRRGRSRAAPRTRRRAHGSLRAAGWRCRRSGRLSDQTTMPKPPSSMPAAAPCAPGAQRAGRHEGAARVARGNPDGRGRAGVRRAGAARQRFLPGDERRAAARQRDRHALGVLVAAERERRARGRRWRRDRAR